MPPRRRTTPLSQLVGSKFAGLVRRKNDNGVYPPPEAIAGLYLRETPRNDLAMMHGTASSAGGGGGGLQDVEFGVVLEGDLVSADGGVEIGKPGEGEGRDVEGAGAGLGGDGEIEMMEMGGEWLGRDAAAVFRWPFFGCLLPDQRLLGLPAASLFR